MPQAFVIIINLKSRLNNYIKNLNRIVNGSYSEKRLRIIYFSNNIT